MYLIFFGKAQSFIFYAYDENGLISNFNKIIPDFDLLESQLLNVDRENNNDIFGKYIFLKGRSEPYSLIKIYSPAQPSVGYRIEGCTYGVAFLSKNNLKISKNNIQILNTIQKAFASVALDGIKFLKTDFIQESTLVFNDFIQKVGFSKIDKNPLFDNNLSNTTTAFYVNSLLDFDIDIAGYSNKIYITEDIERLLRAQKKWGEKIIKIQEKANNSFQEYKPQADKTEYNNNTDSTKVKDSQRDVNQKIEDELLLKIRIQDIEKQFSLTEEKLKKANNQNLRLKTLNKIFILASIILAFVIVFFSYRQFSKQDKPATVKVENPISAINDEINQPAQNITINNSIDVIQKWEKKKDLVDFLNLIIKLESTKTKAIKDSLKSKILKKAFDNEMDTLTINIFLKNI
jgi:hypothetical protein